MGMLMAYAIAGVKTVDLSGRAASFDEAQVKSRQAAHDREALETSGDTNLIQGAASTLQQQLYPLNSLHLTARLLDVEELIVHLYEHANEIDPTMGRWKVNLMSAYRAFAYVTGAPAERIAFLEKALAAAPDLSARMIVLPELSQQYLSAGRVPRTEQLSSYGPGDWSLAEELLAAGDRDSVLAYLDLLRGLWKNDNGRLNTWASTIRSGGTPHFAPNAFPTSQ